MNRDKFHQHLLELAQSHRFVALIDLIIYTDKDIVAPSTIKKWCDELSYTIVNEWGRDYVLLWDTAPKGDK